MEKLDGPALNLSPEEFEGYMRGQRTPAALTKRQQMASDAQKLLEELQGRQEKLHQGVGALNMQLQKWVQVVHSQLDEATSQFDKVQKELPAQAEAAQVESSSAQDGSQQREEEQPPELLPNYDSEALKDQGSETPGMIVNDQR